MSTHSSYEQERDTIYQTGLNKLCAFLDAYGFQLASNQVSIGKGDLERGATFTNANRTIKICFISDIISVSYAIDEKTLSHRKYLLTDSSGASLNYPDFSAFDPEKSFCDVIRDLQNWGSDFLCGDGSLFLEASNDQNRS